MKTTKRNAGFIHIDKDTLYELYWIQGLSLKKIAQSFFVSHPTIINRMNDYGIERKRTGRYEKKTNKKL